MSLSLAASRAICEFWLISVGSKFQKDGSCTSIRAAGVLDVFSALPVLGGGWILRRGGGFTGTSISSCVLKSNMSRWAG